jgi:tetratricopeptide (TPR) repeat protein
MSAATERGFPPPEDAADIAAFVRGLRAVKLWAGDPSLEVLRRRTGVPTSTLSDAFNPQRRRMPSLAVVRAVVRACGADPAQAARWEAAWCAVRERIDAASPAVPAGRSWVPRQLPPDVSGFVGRADALGELAGMRGGAPATVITGTAGVGKTALAVHWAYQIADRYPDGQLYLDLRGHAGAPVITPAEALSLLLQSLEVPSERIPADLHLQMGLYRSVLAGRRVLVVLDNAVDAAHVRPMLPSGPHAHALITSRNALTGLVVREGATRITLDTLTAADSAELLATHLGPGRVAAEPEAAARLADLCAHLPLALRITAANLAGRPSQNIAGAVQELGSTDLLERLRVVGDSESAVAAAFDMSYRLLPAETQRMFSLLGLVPGPEITRDASAVLLGRDPADPVPELDELVSAHLLFESSPGRYRTHDLLARYARRRAATEPEALHRLLSWYVLNTDAATRIMLPSFWLEDRTELALAGTPYEFADAEQARSWLAAEVGNLTEAVTYAADHGPAPFAWHLAHALRGFLHTRGSGLEKLAVAQVGLRAAETAGNALGQALCHMYLGMLAVSTDDLRTASDEFAAARSQFAHIHHARGVEAASNNLGDICVRLGEITRAASYFEQASTDPSTLNPHHFCNLALLHRIRGEHAEALRLNAECLAFAERTGAIQLAAMTKTGMGSSHLELDDPATAEPLLREAHQAAVTIGSEVDAYDAMAGLILVCARTGRCREAFTWVASLTELLERGVYSCGGDDWAHAAIVEAHLTSGRLDEALSIGLSALDQREQAGRRLTVMRLRVLLCRTLAARGDLDAARPHWRAALDYATEQALPDRIRIAALLPG